MIEIIWIHVRHCWRDLRAHRLGELNYYHDHVRDTVSNDKREWRLK